MTATADLLRRAAQVAAADPDPRWRPVAAWLQASAELHPPGEDGWGDDHASAVARSLLGGETDR